MAGQKHKSWSPGPSQINLHWSAAAESPALLDWPHHLDGWWIHTKAAALWWISTRTKKTRPATKVLQRHTEEQPELVWHQTFFNSTKQPRSAPTGMYWHTWQVHNWRKRDEQNSLQPTIITKELPLSLLQCWPFSVPPSFNSANPVWAVEPFRSLLTGTQTKSPLNPRDNHHYILNALNDVNTEYRNICGPFHRHFIFMQMSVYLGLWLKIRYVI